MSGLLSIFRTDLAPFYRTDLAPFCDAESVYDFCSSDIGIGMERLLSDVHWPHFYGRRRKMLGSPNDFDCQYDPAGNVWFVTGLTFPDRVPIGPDPVY